jgi:HlyD family secretion protein
MVASTDATVHGPWVMRLTALLCPVALVVVTAACEANKADGGASGPVTYRTVPVKKETLEVSIEATGTLQPAAQVEIGSRVGGQVAKVLVDFNDAVKAGQLLAEIDPTQLRARRDEARGSVAAARAELERARADLAQKEQAAARSADLRARGLNAPAELESATAGRDVARAQMNVAQAQLDRAQAALASADSDLQATRIVSPIDGVVLARAIEAGQTVAASFQTPRLFVIAGTLAHLEVIANVDEADLAIVTTGATGSVKVDAYPGRTFPAVVRQIRVDPKTEQGVVTFPVVLNVDNPEGVLLPGMTSTVSIDGAPVKDALVVPSAALRYTPSAPEGEQSAARENGSRVFVLVDGKPKPHKVKVGAKAGGRVQIEGEGIAEGVAIVVEDTGGGPKKNGSQRTGPRIF